MNLLLTNVLLVFVAICISLLLCGAMLRAALPQDLGGSWEVYTNDGLLANKSAGTAFHHMVRDERSIISHRHTGVVPRSV